MLLPLSLVALGLASTSSSVLATTAGSFVDGGHTLVSAMMMFLGNEEKVYILDKAEGNAATVAGHAAWGAVYDIATRKATVMDIRTNSFCASGMHLPNGSFATFGGNGAIGPGGNVGSQKTPWGSGEWDSTYQEFDGTKSIRILNPCTNADNINAPNCQWFDEPGVLSMQKQRWYSTAEPLADGSMVLIGGFVNGGYINRNYPNVDPQFEGGAAENTFEFYPANGRGVTPLNFLIKTSGLNAYAHAFLMNSGKIFLQANYSSTIWDPNTNQETDLPDMPGKVVRVYPASGAVAMLPLTPANNYNPTVLFCGGSDMPDEAWGNYANPAINTWEYPASRDCQRITPEPTDGSAPVYVKDDEMIEGRTMGQFIILPNGKYLVINGGVNGTAGYAQQTGQTASYGDMPYGMSLASGPVGTPAIYDPNAPAGSRWSKAGLGTSNIARLYHSSAMLLPDGSVLVAGSNPNVDVNITATFPTEYRAEIFYPPYFAASTRPAPTGLPKTISYGGNSFDVTIPASSYSGSANSAAQNTTVVLVRGGFTTHAMNMGQRYVQLNNTFTVNKDGSYVLHVGQAPNPFVLQPGPALIFVVVNGIPSKGTMVTVGNGQMGAQPTSAQPSLPESVLLDGAKGSADGASTTGSEGNDSDSSGSGSSSHTGAIIGGVVAAVAALGLLGFLVGVLLARRRRAAAATTAPSGHRQVPSTASSYGMTTAGGVGAGVGAGAALMGAQHGHRDSDSSAFVPLRAGENYSGAWNTSTYSLNSTPYTDQASYQYSVPGSPRGASIDYDPYAVGRSTPRPAPGRY